MNDTTITPDDPGGRGAVVTDRQAGAVPEQQGSNAGSQPAAPGAGANHADDAVGGNGVDPGGVACSTGTSGAGSAGPPAPPASIGRMWLPSANGSVTHPAPGSPIEVRVTTVPSDADVTRPLASVGEASRPQSALPGPVPGPGPAAATPPPWHRVPGPETRNRAAVPPFRPAGGLLDDCPPTTIVEPPGRHGVSPSTPSESPPSGTGRWSTVRAVRNRPPRQAALQLKRLDPWSVLKLALVLAVVLFFIFLVAVGVLYGVLDGIGVWDRLNGTYADLVSGDAPSGSPLISAGRVFGLAAVIGAINSLLFAVAVTVAAFVYNVSADLVGGIEVTLSERD